MPSPPFLAARAAAAAKALVEPQPNATTRLKVLLARLQVESPEHVTAPATAFPCLTALTLTPQATLTLTTTTPPKELALILVARLLPIIAPTVTTPIYWRNCFAVITKQTAAFSRTALAAAPSSVLAMFASRESALTSLALTTTRPAAASRTTTTQPLELVLQLPLLAGT